MDFSLRLRLSLMMFLQYFVWGSWGVVIFKFMGSLPVEGGLSFPGTLQGWIDATGAIGAMISPLFVGLFADRFFSTEKVLAFLHLAGALLLGWAAYHCDQNVPVIRSAFEAAAQKETVGQGNLLETINQEKQLKKEIEEVSGPMLTSLLRNLGGRPAENKERLAVLEKRLKEIQADVQPAVTKVSKLPEVSEPVNTAYQTLFWLMLAYALCYLPTVTLTNSLSFRNLTNPDKYFGSIRVLGTIGWIVAGMVVGFTLNEVSAQPLYLAAGASVLLGLFCFALPHTPPAGGVRTLADSIGLPALAMIKNRSFFVFLLCSFLITIVLKFYYQQGNAFVTDIGTPYPAAVMTLGQISEIFFMLLIPVGLAWLGTKGMLVLGMLAWCLRYAIFTSQNVPAVIGLGLPLHGICYDFFFVVSYLYVDRHAPKHLRASAQGMITFVTLGVGMFLGSLLAGIVVDICNQGPITLSIAGWPIPKLESMGIHLDELLITPWSQIWLVPLVGSVAATLLFALLFREPKAPGLEKTAD